MSWRPLRHRNHARDLLMFASSVAWALAMFMFLWFGLFIASSADHVDQVVNSYEVARD